MLTWNLSLIMNTCRISKWYEQWCCHLFAHCVSSYWSKILMVVMQESLDWFTRRILILLLEPKWWQWKQSKVWKISVTCPLSMQCTFLRLCCCFYVTFVPLMCLRLKLNMYITVFNFLASWLPSTKWTHVQSVLNYMWLVHSDFQHVDAAYINLP